MWSAVRLISILDGAPNDNDDAAEDDDDVRDKYVARKLFRSVFDGETLFPDQGHSPAGLKPFSQSLRPANVLLDDNLKVDCVID